MLFWTVIFILMYGYTLIYGNFLAKPLNELAKVIIEIKEAEKFGIVLTDNDKKRLARKSFISLILAIVPAIFFIVTELIYFTIAIPLDPFKYPSIGMLVFVIFNFIFVKKTTKKADLETEEGFEEYKREAKKIKRYTLRGWLIGLIKFVYFLYMFWALSFGLYY